jgi:hypothetical protein
MSHQKLTAEFPTAPRRWRELSWSERYARQKARWHYQLVRLDRDDLPALRAMAGKQNVSVAELIRTFIAWGLENGKSAR